MIDVIHIHDRDIRGADWSPCVGCPHPTPGICPSRRHRALCDWRAADPSARDPAVAALAAEDRPPRLVARPPAFDSLARPPRPGVARVGLVTPGLLLGGAERWAVSLLEATASAPFGWVGIACRHEGQGHPPLVEALGRHCPVGWGEAAVAELARACDVVVLWGLPGGVAAIRAANPAAKVVLVSHGVCDWTARAVAEAELADALVAVARPAARPFPTDQQTRVEVIYNTAAARPATEPADSVRRRWGVPEGHRVLLYLGRISPEKYPEGVVLAAPHLPEGWTAVMVGPHPDLLRTRADAVPAGRLILAGPTDDPGSALGAADAMILPSWGEGMSIAMLEAWLAGLPTIATAVGVAEERPDLVRVIPRGADGPTIAAALAADLADPEGTRDRARAARRFASETMSADRFRASWRALLARVAGVADPPPVPATAPAVVAPDGPARGPVDGAALVASLTDAQREAVRACGHRRQVPGCCGPYDACDLGRGTGGRVVTLDCARCVAADLPR